MTDWQILWPSMLLLVVSLAVLGIAAGVNRVTRSYLTELKKLASGAPPRP